MTFDPNDNDAGVFDPYEEDEEEAPVMDEFGNLIDPDEVPVEEEEAEEDGADEELPFGEDADLALDADPADESEAPSEEPEEPAAE